MNPTLRQIRSFVAVSRLRSFTQAAKELHLSQPALTVQIRQLEEMLGMPLFDRNTRSVQPTRAGRELAPQLERLQLELETVLAQTREQAKGQRGVVRLA
jgi:DNA-binding transcriptional LysR family regulator